MNTDTQYYDATEGATGELSSSDADLASEYQAYRKAADTAHEDSIRAYENMDKWMLALASGAFALCLTLASNSSGISVVFYIGLLLFSISISLLLYSKYASYKMCELSAEEIEDVYRCSPDCFTAEYHKTAAGKAARFNRTNERKNTIALWTFIAGITCVSLSLLPISACELLRKNRNDHSNARAAEANAPATAATTTAQGSASPETTSAAASP